jgi:hypothetical protein
MRIKLNDTELATKLTRNPDGSATHVAAVPDGLKFDGPLLQLSLQVPKLDHLANVKRRFGLAVSSIRFEHQPPPSR